MLVAGPFGVHPEEGGKAAADSLFWPGEGAPCFFLAALQHCIPESMKYSVYMHQDDEADSTDAFDEDEVHVHTYTYFLLCFSYAMDCGILPCIAIDVQFVTQCRHLPAVQLILQLEMVLQYRAFRNVWLMVYEWKSLVPTSSSDSYWVGLFCLPYGED